MQDPLVWVVVFAIFVMSVVAHEVAHGYLAFRCGDPTAYRAGRLTLNPLAHIDPFRTVVVPLMFMIAQSPVVLGGAKPVPVNPFLFRRLRRDWFLVSAAGCATNLLIAAGLAVVIRLLIASQLFPPGSVGVLALARGMLINIFLALFNLVPIPPLDGSRVVVTLVPKVEPLFGALEPVGLLLVFFALLWTPLGNYLATAALFLSRLLLGL